MHGPEFQLSESGATELYSEQSVTVPAPLNVKCLGRASSSLQVGVDRCLLGEPFLLHHSQGEDSPCFSSSMR